MKKLKLDSFEVTSFETSPARSGARGTVRGLSREAPSILFCEPTDAAMDCTYGCSRHTGCEDTCGFTESIDCP